MHADVAAPSAYRRRPAREGAPPGLIRSIRSCGSISVAGDQPAQRTAAAKLAIAGLVSIDEICKDGSFKALTPADVLLSHSASSWRVSLRRHA